MSAHAQPASFDLIVLGSGAAGLSAALVASVAGRRVLVAEKSDYIGGTTAMSGGCIWVPNHHLMPTVGAVDSRDAALAYLRAVAPDGWAETEDLLWQAFVDAAPAMLRFLEAHTPLRFKVGLEPDPYLEAPGAVARGRNVAARPMRLADLGPWRQRLRPSPMPTLLAYDEITDHHLNAMPWRGFTRFGHRLLWRWLSGRRAMGQSLVAGLLAGCLRHGCTVRTGLRGRSLIRSPRPVRSPRASSERAEPPVLERDEGRVSGVVFDGGETLHASLGVVIATGGFEWNDELMARHHPGPRRWTASPDSNAGDGLLMAAEAGAQLAHMDQALTMGTRPVDYMGRPHAVPAADYTLPHSMIVDARGRRFVNEVQVNVGLGLERRDGNGQRIHDPAWRIYDAQYARRYRHALPRGPELTSAPSLRELAARIGVDADGLVDEAAKISRYARDGHDLDFGRGTHGWDPGRNGDPRMKPNSCLGSIEEPPFFAFPFPVSFLGTKGGPRTDALGRVLRSDGSVIEGLYCAGNAMANPIGSKAVGAGTTLGPCLTWGYICGQTALAEAREIAASAGISSSAAAALSAWRSVTA